MSRSSLSILVESSNVQTSLCPLMPTIRNLSRLTPDSPLIQMYVFLLDISCAMSNWLSSQGWSIFIQSQQILVAATQFVIDVKKWIPTRTNMPYIVESMQRLDTWASALLARSSLPPSVAQSGNSSGVSERITAQSIRTIARIKISRFVPKPPHKHTKSKS